MGTRYPVGYYGLQSTSTESFTCISLEPRTGLVALLHYEYFYSVPVLPSQLALLSSHYPNRASLTLPTPLLSTPSSPWPLRFPLR